MSDYTKTTDFAAKDSLPGGDPGKIIKGSEFETEFDNIVTAIATKYDSTEVELAAIAGLTSAANKVPMFSGSGTATLLDFKDDDTMADNSATAVPSQQSVKAYVDTTVAVPAASTTVAGKVELATSAETITRSSNTLALTPLSIADLIQGSVYFTPTFTSFTLGNGSAAGYCTRHGNATTVVVKVALGSTSAFSGTNGIDFILPTTAMIPTYEPVGTAIFVDAGTVTPYGGYFTVSEGSRTTRFHIAAATNAKISATVPFTWAAVDFAMFSITYLHAST